MVEREAVDELKRKIGEERAALIEAARRLSPEDLRRVPVDAEGEEQWTALEQLAHLCEMEQNYDAWVRAALDRDGADLSGVVPEPVAIPVEAANGSSREALLEQMALARAYTLGMIDGMALEAFDRRAVSPAFGSLTVLQWLRSFYRHDRQHTAQMLGRQSDYRPNFANGREPNQRLARLALVSERQRNAAP